MSLVSLIHVQLNNKTQHNWITNKAECKR